MTDAEVATIEEALHLKLPKQYLELVRKVPNVFRRTKLTMTNRPLWANEAHELMHFNLGIRRSPAYWCREPAAMKEKWPDYLFVCGAERTGSLLYLIDCRKKYPPILEINSRDKKLVTSEKYSNLEALYAREMELIDQELTKLARKAGMSKEELQKKSLLPTREVEKPVRAASTTRPASPRQKAGANKATKAIEKLLLGAGFKLVPPKRKHSIAELTADVLPSLPDEMLAFYTVCDGGTCKNLNLRVVPLTEAVDGARFYANGYPSMGYIPMIADINGESCCLVTKGPLRGYVVLVHHDGPLEIKARSLRGFLQVLAKNRDAKEWWLEDAMYDEGRPRGQTPFELSGKDRTAGDVKAARALLKLAQKLADGEDEAEEHLHLFELALMLLSEKQSKDVLALLKHRDHEVRRLAEERAAKLTKPAAAAAGKNGR